MPLYFCLTSDHQEAQDKSVKFVTSSKFENQTCQPVYNIWSLGLELISEVKIMQNDIRHQEHWLFLERTESVIHFDKATNPGRKFWMDHHYKLSQVSSTFSYCHCQTSNFKIISGGMLQANLCWKLLFLHQITHNMTKDCSLIYQFTWKLQAQNMLCT